VAIAAHAGTGKSRLAHEFASRLAGPDWLVLEAPADDADRNATYLPFARLLRDWCGAEPDDPPADVLDRISKGLSELCLDGMGLLAPLASILDIYVDDPVWLALLPATRRRRIAEATLSLLRSIAERTKLLLVIEDAHRLDRESEELFGRLVEELPDIPILVVATYRPEYRESWNRSDCYHKISLTPLKEADCRTLLDLRLGVDPELDPVKAQLTLRTQGVPLFIEEMIRTLSETDVLAGEPGRYRITGTLGRVQIPGSLQSVLAARIDRLPRQRKHFLQVAAVIGGEFSLSLLSGVLRQPIPRLAAVLAALRDDDFIVARGAKALPRFAFRHVLIEEIAYHTLLSSRRIQIHRDIARTMETLYSERIEQYAETIAWHAAKGEMWDTAISYMRRAARKAIDRAAHSAAIRFIEQALSAISRLPERGRQVVEAEIELRLLLRVSQGALGLYDQWVANVDAAEQLARELGDPKQLLAIQVARLHLLSIHDGTAIAIGACSEAQQMAADQGNSHQLVAATYFLAQALNWHGDFQAAVAALNALQPTLSQLAPGSRCGMTGTAKLMCEAQLASSHAALGNFREAIGYGRAAWRNADTTKRDFDRAVASFGYGMALFLKGDIERCIRIFDAGLTATEASDIPLLFASIAGPLSYAYLLNGDKGRALALSQQLLARREVSSYSRSWSLLYRALICLESGLPSQAQELALEALERAHSKEYGAIQATAHLILSRVLRSSEHDAAGNHLAEAIALGEERAMRPLLAHCLADRARLFASAGEIDVAIQTGKEANHGYRDLGMQLWIVKSDLRQYYTSMATNMLVTASRGS